MILKISIILLNQIYFINIIFLIYINWNFFSHFLTSWLKLSHCTWWIFFSMLLWNCTIILWIWIFFYFYWIQITILIFLLIFYFIWYFSIHSNWTFCSSLTLWCTWNTICNILFIWWKSNIYFYILSFMKFYFIKTIATKSFRCFSFYDSFNQAFC